MKLDAKPGRITVPLPVAGGGRQEALMSEQKPVKPSSPDSLIKDLEPKGAALDEVTGGKMKSSDKQQQQMLDYLKG